MSYRMVEVPEDAPAQLEQLGTKAKFWFRAADGTRTLFKEGYAGSGEHWSVKIACEVARSLRLPHAEYELAIWRGRPGVVSPTIVPKGGRLIHGNELLAKIFAEYEETRRFRAHQHTLRRVLAVLRSKSVKTPLGWNCAAEVGNAAGVFVGYLLLDALIGNQDRHHENWGLIRSPEHGLALAPTFDHASSLGRNETDDVRTERLMTSDVGRSIKAYVRRAKSGLYKSQSGRKPLTTLEAFTEAAVTHPVAGDFWRQRLYDLSAADLERLVHSVPADVLTRPAADFALQVMVANRIRLLELE